MNKIELICEKCNKKISVVRVCNCDPIPKRCEICGTRLKTIGTELEMMYGKKAADTLRKGVIAYYGDKIDHFEERNPNVDKN